MDPRIERRRARCGRWLLYPLIAVSACALAGLVSAAPAAGNATVPPSAIDLPQKAPLHGH